MNDIADRKQLIEINYYASGKFIGVTLSAVYPNYREGDTGKLCQHLAEFDPRTQL
jgi:hypothetical protein